MKTLCAKSRSAQRSRSRERVRRRVQALAKQTLIEESARDAALTRLLSVLVQACPEAVLPEHTAFRTDDPYSRLSRLRAAHAAYALATMGGVERASEGAYVRA